MRCNIVTYILILLILFLSVSTINAFDKRDVYIAFKINYPNGFYDLSTKTYTDVCGYGYSMDLINALKLRATIIKI